MREKLQRLPLVLAFFLPLSLAVLICILHGIYPFGDSCLLQIDMFHQYCPFSIEMMEKLQNGGSFFYSWKLGLGSDYISHFAYYLASPFNWLLVFCSRDYIIEFMSVLILLKIGFCGLTFAAYLRRHFKSNHILIAVFGTAYALSGYMAAYSWNVMWLDCIVLAPLIIMGVEQLVKEGKSGLYYITLALSVLSNYYISFLICMFLVFWFLITWVGSREAGIRAFLRFALYSLLAGGTGAVFMIPEAVILGYSGSQGISFPEQIKWYFNLIDQGARHAFLTDIYTGTSHWPNLYCGVFVFCFVILYALNGKIKLKERILKLLLFVFFFLSFANNILDFIWHGFHFPDSLPGRQSFLYIFLLLTLSFEAFLLIRENKLWHFAVAAVLNAVFWAAAYKRADFEQVSEAAFLFTAVFLAGYLIFSLLLHFQVRKINNILIGCVCVLALTEITLNFHKTGFVPVYRPTYVARMADYDMLTAYAKEDNDSDGGGFYRVEELERKTKNDASLYGYSSATLFSSLMNIEISHFYQKVGMEGGKNYYCYNGQTPLISAMLSVKYILADNGLEESPICEYLASSGDSYLYKNKYSLPLGFMMDEDVIEEWQFLDMEQVEAQNRLAKLLGAKEDLLTQVSSVSVEGETTIHATEDGYLYARYESTGVDKLTLETSGGRTRDYTHVAHKYTLDLGYNYAGSTLWIRNEKNENLRLTVYRLNEEALREAYETLSEQTMELTAFSDTKIEGTIQVQKAGRLIFSVPYEEGWSIYVDGEDMTDCAEGFEGALYSLYLDSGEYEICLKYRTPKLLTGALITAFCIVSFVLIQIFTRKKVTIHSEEESGH